MALRSITNTISMIISLIMLIIFLYIVFNFKKILDKMLNTGLVVLKDNKKNIQPVLDNFSKTTALNLMDDKDVNQKLQKNMNKQVTDVLKNKDTQSQLNNTLGNAITSNQDNINAAMVNAIKSDGTSKALDKAAEAAIAKATANLFN